MLSNSARNLTAAALAAALAACGGGQQGNSSNPMPAKGQVAPVKATAVTTFAAARFAEQVSFGPTAALVAEIQSKGYEKWIDDQFALPGSQVDPTPFLGFPDPTPPEHWRMWQTAWPNLAISAPDQLRLRVTWGLSQFLVVSDRKNDLVAALGYGNLLSRQAFGNYGELLYQISINPGMAAYLDNNQNRPKSAECPHCAPNENYARELMQLFSLGVFKLNPDGTPVRGAGNSLVETYTQRDVEELARVLTGWNFDNSPSNRPNRNWGNWLKTMVPSTWAPERDSGAKIVLGRSFPAGQSQDKDLRDAVAMLMAHQNIAPFVATRLIQHLVKSNPSPAYVGRVAATFRDNGSGVAGDMKAIIKAVLLDREARAGDNPANSARGDGKIREPFLFATALYRGLGCSKVPENKWGPLLSGNQRPFTAESVFSFYAPTDRAPGSNLLAPEQRLLNANEFTDRLNRLNSTRWDESGNASRKSVDAAGCDVGSMVSAYQASPRAFNDWLSARFFRGAMPPTLRSNIELLIQQPQWNANDADESSYRLLDYALSTPYFGVMK
jgi:uncharacterized protein (DUF1800 family)